MLWLPGAVVARSVQTEHSILTATDRNVKSEVLMEPQFIASTLTQENVLGFRSLGSDEQQCCMPQSFSLSSTWEPTPPAPLGLRDVSGEINGAAAAAADLSQCVVCSLLLLSG